MSPAAPLVGDFVARPADVATRPQRLPVLRLMIRCRLRDVRGERSLQQMSRVCGIHRGTLSQLERGERLPRPSDVPLLELAYGDRAGWWTVEITSDVTDRSDGLPAAPAATPQEARGH